MNRDFFCGSRMWRKLRARGIVAHWMLLRTAYTNINLSLTLVYILVEMPPLIIHKQSELLYLCFRIDKISSNDGHQSTDLGLQEKETTDSKQLGQNQQQSPAAVYEEVLNPANENTYSNLTDQSSALHVYSDLVFNPNQWWRSAGRVTVGKSLNSGRPIRTFLFLFWWLFHNKCTGPLLNQFLSNYKSSYTTHITFHDGFTGRNSYV